MEICGHGDFEKRLVMFFMAFKGPDLPFLDDIYREWLCTECHPHHRCIGGRAFFETPEDEADWRARCQQITKLRIAGCFPAPTADSVGLS